MRAQSPFARLSKLPVSFVRASPGRIFTSLSNRAKAHRPLSRYSTNPSRTRADSDKPDRLVCGFNRCPQAARDRQVSAFRPPPSRSRIILQGIDHRAADRLEARSSIPLLRSNGWTDRRNRSAPFGGKESEGLVYVGGCGTGWSNQASMKLRELLNAIPADSPAVKLRRKGVVFARPLLVADVEYRAWTQDVELRHPSYKSVGEMVGPREAYEITKEY